MNGYLCADRVYLFVCALISLLQKGKRGNGLYLKFDREDIIDLGDNISRRYTNYASWKQPRRPDRSFDC